MLVMGFGDNPVPRAKFLSHLQSGDLAYDKIEQEMAESHIHGHAAVVTGRTHITYRFRGEEDFERFAYTSTYVRVDGEWKMVAYQAAFTELAAEIEEQNKEAVKRVFEEMNKGNIEIMNEFYAPDYGYYSPSNNPKPMSRKEAREFLNMVYSSFPDVNWSIEDLIAKDDRIVVRFVVTGTHQGEFQGITATGNKIEVGSILIWSLKNKIIVEEREEANMLEMMQQLGMELKPKEGEN